MRILLFDNYDSFTYNLVQILEELIDENDRVEVVKNDKITLKEVEQYDKIILSPGPGIPSESGVLLPLIKEYIDKKPIFGVCLGLQAICEALGGKLTNLSEVHHGVESLIQLTGNKSLIYNDIKTPIKVGRYHSWVVSKDNFPEELAITAVDEKGLIMSVQHKQYNVCAVQYHPESILTPQGKKMLKNWMES